MNSQWFIITSLGFFLSSLLSALSLINVFYLFLMTDRLNVYIYIYKLYYVTDVNFLMMNEMKYLFSI